MITISGSYMSLLLKSLFLHKAVRIITEKAGCIMKKLIYLTICGIIITNLIIIGLIALSGYKKKI